MENVSRRSFIKTAGAAGAVTAGLAVATASAAEEAPSWMPEWTDETDILIIGFGGAGAAAAITCFLEDCGECIIVDAAPEAWVGGNTRVAQAVVFNAHNKESLLKYQKAMNSIYEIPEERLDAWADGLMENPIWLEAIGANPQDTGAYSPEFSDLEGSEDVQCICANGTFGDEGMWLALMGKLSEYDYDVRYSTRAVALVQNPLTEEILGARMEDGSCIKARKGVIMSCGGFEYNEKLMDSYYPVGCKKCIGIGTPYNRGDGINMVTRVGANLWHMNNYASAGYGIPVPFDGDPLNPGLTMNIPISPKAKDWILVSPTAERFMYEEEGGITKHGKERKNHGSYEQAATSYPSYVIFGNNCAQAGITYTVTSFLFAHHYGLVKTPDEYVADGVMVKCDTVEELAEKLNLNPVTLAKTIEDYNSYCDQNFDPDFGRGQIVYGDSSMGDPLANVGVEKPVSIDAFDLVRLEPPFYAAMAIRSGINTQGGPESNELKQILRSDGTVIPRLYSAGEFGSIYPYMYNGGGNIAEAISSGRIAARNCGKETPWE